jgi:hypothetical protein
MLDQIQRYPLHWPDGQKRTPLYQRKASSFKATLAVARDGILHQIKLLGGRNAIISSNLRLREDGLPYAQQPKTDDMGIAVYFVYRDKPTAFACDQYRTIADNMRAIEKTIEALRGIERWGSSTMMEQAFRGFTALEHKPEERWWEVLGVSELSSHVDVEVAYRTARSRAHPDNGGDSAQFDRVQRAWEAYRRG